MAESSIPRRTKNLQVVPKICEYCGEPFTRDRAREMERQKYCSVACKNHALAGFAVIDGVEHKRCRKCDKVKPFDDFHKYHRTNHGHRSYCKECAAAYMRVYCKDRREHRYALTKKYRAENLEKMRALQRKQNNSARLECIKALGGACVCCGDTMYQFLNIDHIHNDGKEQRKTVNGGPSMYRWLRRNGFPRDRFQLLCYNCNICKAQWGECPHETERRRITGTTREEIEQAA